MLIYQPKDNFEIDYAENTTRHSSTHFHNTYEITFFLSGSRRYIINNSNIYITPNTVILINPFTFHSTQGSVGASRYVIEFSEDLLLKYFKADTVKHLLKCFSCSFVDCCKKVPFIRTSIEQIYSDFQNNNELSVALNLANLLLTLSSVTDIKKVPDTNVGNNAKIQTILKYIHENIATVKTIKQIADYAHMSASYLSAMFKQTTGLSIMQYVISIRINIAAKELIYTDKSIEAIAFDCGFEYPGYFCNTFKKLVGESPTAYRKDIKKISPSK